MTKITFTGDIIIAPEQLQAITKNADGNFSTIFEPIASLLKESDFVVGNLETPLGGKNLGYTNHNGLLTLQMNWLMHCVRLVLICLLQQIIIVWIGIKRAWSALFIV